MPTLAGLLAQAAEAAAEVVKGQGQGHMGRLGLGGVMVTGGAGAGAGAGADKEGGWTGLTELLRRVRGALGGVI